MTDRPDPGRSAPWRKEGDSELDSSLVLDLFSETEREIVDGWLFELGLEAHEWPHCPPLKSLLLTIGPARLAAEWPDDVDLLPRLRLAFERLGVEDPDREARACYRRAQRWLERAVRGQNVTQDGAEVRDAVG